MAQPSKRQRVENILNSESQSDKETTVTFQPLNEPFRLENSIFGTKPSEDLARCVSDFLFKNGRIANLEIEGKLGILIDKKTNRRISLPVITETGANKPFSIILMFYVLFKFYKAPILAVSYYAFFKLSMILGIHKLLVLLQEKQSWYRFQSDMSENQHKNFNKLLNSRFSETQDPRYTGSKISYKHTKEIDKYYNRNGTRVRVTYDQNTDEMIGSITKKQIASLDIYSPRTNLDFRISINQEIPVEVPESQTQLYERQKDRVSYHQDLYSVDLTKVIALEENKPKSLYISSKSPKTSHELEIEVANTAVFAAELNKAHLQQPNRFNEIIQVFINNLKVLAKNSVRE